LNTVLLGSRTDGDYLNALTCLPNVHTHKHVGRGELVAAIRNADVALVAHRVTNLTRAMSPLKIYEYVAGGCPVLSVDLPPCRSISPRVILTRSVADFADVLDDALALGRAPEPDRMAFVRANSWQERHRQILGIALAAA
jgi:glycosyltransferase involved in cell wall biosynthesis